MSRSLIYLLESEIFSFPGRPHNWKFSFKVWLNSKKLCIRPTKVMNPSFESYACASELQKLCIRASKVVHPSFKSCVSELQKLCIRASKVMHPSFKSCASELQKLCIRPTKLAHLTYKTCTSDLQKLCIQPTKYVHLTYVFNRNFDPYGSTVNYILVISAVPA